MTTNTIFQTICTVPESRVAFVFDKEQISYGDLKLIHQHNKIVIDELRGAKVAISGRTRREFAMLLALLDGVADRILFLPQDVDNDLRELYFKQSDIDYQLFYEAGQVKYQKTSSNEIIKSKSDQSTEWVIPTSGTTKIPKLVVHSFSTLTRTAKLNIESGDKFVWGLVFDIYRFSGIQVFLQSVLSGSTIVIPESDLSIGETLKMLAKNLCNTLSATPSFWRKALMSPEIKNLKLNNITLGGEISDNTILAALKKQFPELKIRHIYASTEVGVGFSVTDGQAGFPKDYLERGVNGVKIKIDNAGLMWLCPPTQSQRYLSNQDMFDETGFVNTGDLVEIIGDRVYFLGRDSGAINVGGNKVQPEEVEFTILGSGLAQAVKVYAKKNPIMGSLVCADIVPAKGSTSDQQELKKAIFTYCKDNLENYKVPALLSIVDELQITASGKLSRS